MSIALIDDSRIHSSTISEKRLAANRANAKRSTGPRTREGKSRSAQNALKHGLRSSKAHSFAVGSSPPIQNPQSEIRNHVCPTFPPPPNECSATYSTFCHEIEQELRPATPLQTALCHQICLALWKLRRIPHIEQQLFTHHSSLNPEPRTLNPCQILAQSFQDPATHHDLHLLDRYERSTRNQFLRLLTTYRAHTKFRPTTPYDKNEPPVPEERAWIDPLPPVAAAASAPPSPPPSPPPNETTPPPTTHHKPQTTHIPLPIEPAPSPAPAPNPTPTPLSPPPFKPTTQAQSAIRDPQSEISNLESKIKEVESSIHYPDLRDPIQRAVDRATISRARHLIAELTQRIPANDKGQMTTDPPLAKMAQSTQKDSSS